MNPDQPPSGVTLVVRAEDFAIYYVSNGNVVTLPSYAHVKQHEKPGIVLIFNIIKLPEGVKPQSILIEESTYYVLWIDNGATFRIAARSIKEEELGITGIYAISKTLLL